MPRIKTKKQNTNIITEYVTIISNLVMDTKQGFEVPDDIAKTVGIQFGNPGTVSCRLKFKDPEERDVDQVVRISRSGITLGIPKIWIPEIKKQLKNQNGFKFTNPFYLLDTGSNNGTDLSHYKAEDILTLQNKIMSSDYLKSTLPQLVDVENVNFIDLESEVED